MLGDNAVKLFKDRYVAVVVYRNPHPDQVYYDTVIWRVVRGAWRRDAHYRPDDLPKLVLLLNDAANAIDEMQNLDEKHGIDRNIGFVSRTGCTIISQGGSDERPNDGKHVPDDDAEVGVAGAVGALGKGSRG